MVSHQDADELTRLSDSMSERWKGARLITKSEDLEFTTSGRGTMAQVVHPGLGHVNAHLGCFIRELPPGKPSGEHRHNFEAVLHVLEGVGYTMMDGVRYDWKVGDTMTVPSHGPAPALQPRPRQPGPHHRRHQLASHAQLGCVPLRATAVCGGPLRTATHDHLSVENVPDSASEAGKDV